MCVCVCVCVYCSLICDEDKEYFQQMLYDMLKSRFEFKESYEETFVDRKIMFGEHHVYTHPHKITHSHTDARTLPG